MQFFQISGGNLTIPTYAVGVAVARAVKRDSKGELLAMPDPVGPPGCVKVEVKDFRMEFHPQSKPMVLDRLKKAEVKKGYVRVLTDRDCLCMSETTRDQLVKKIEAL